MAVGVAAVAQPSGQPSLVDRAVGDLDPLAASTRRIDPAYGTTPTRDQLFQLRTANPQTGTPGQFLLQAPEFRATFTQPDYLTLTAEGIDLNTAQVRDGAYIEIIPPGTVFHLGEAPGLSSQAAPVGPDRRLFRGEPMDGRIGLVTDALPIDPRLHRDAGFSPVLPPNAAPQAAPPPPVQLQPWVTAADLREANRVDVPIPDRIVLPDDPSVWTPEPESNGSQNESTGEASAPAAD